MSYLNKSYETTIDRVLLEDPWVRIKIGYIEESEDVAAFSVKMQYEVSDQWLPVSEIPHESRIGYRGHDIKRRGMVLYVYKDKDIYKKREPVQSDQLQDETGSGCLDAAQVVTLKLAPELLTEFENSHGLQ